MSKTKKLYICQIAVSVVLMIVIPWLFVKFIQPGDFRTRIFLFMFLIVNPIYFAVTGALAGLNEKELWAQPLIPAIFYITGTWTFLEFGEFVFVLFFGSYISIGYLLMLASSKLTNKREKEE